MAAAVAGGIRWEWDRSLTRVQVEIGLYYLRNEKDLRSVSMWPVATASDEGPRDARRRQGKRTVRFK